MKGDTVHFKISHGGVARRFALSREKDLLAALKARVLKIVGAEVELYWRDEDSLIVLEDGDDLHAAVDYAETKNKLGCVALETGELRKKKEDEKTAEVKEVSMEESKEAFNGFAFMCDECDTYLSPSNGGRFKCTICDNYDLCAACVVKKTHDNHALVLLRDGETEVPLVNETGGVLSMQTRDAPRCTPTFLAKAPEQMTQKKKVEKQHDNGKKEEMSAKDEPKKEWTNFSPTLNKLLDDAYQKEMQKGNEKDSRLIGILNEAFGDAVETDEDELIAHVGRQSIDDMIDERNKAIIRRYEELTGKVCQDANEIPHSERVAIENWKHDEEKDKLFAKIFGWSGEKKKEADKSTKEKKDVYSREAMMKIKRELGEKNDYSREEMLKLKEEVATPPATSSIPAELSPSFPQKKKQDPRKKRAGPSARSGLLAGPGFTSRGEKKKEAKKEAKKEKKKEMKVAYFNLSDTEEDQKSAIGLGGPGEEPFGRMDRHVFGAHDAHRPQRGYRGAFVVDLAREVGWNRDGRREERGLLDSEQRMEREDDVYGRRAGGERREERGLLDYDRRREGMNEVNRREEPQAARREEAPPVRALDSDDEGFAVREDVPEVDIHRRRFDSTDDDGFSDGFGSERGYALGPRDPLFPVAAVQPQARREPVHSQIIAAARVARAAERLEDRGEPANPAAVPAVRDRSEIERLLEQRHEQLANQRRGIAAARDQPADRQEGRRELLNDDEQAAERGEDRRRERDERGRRPAAQIVWSDEESEDERRRQEGRLDSEQYSLSHRTRGNGFDGRRDERYRGNRCYDDDVYRGFEREDSRPDRSGFSGRRDGGFSGFGGRREDSRRYERSVPRDSLDERGDRPERRDDRDLYRASFGGRDESSGRRRVINPFDTWRDYDDVYRRDADRRNDVSVQGRYDEYVASFGGRDDSSDRRNARDGFEGRRDHVYRRFGEKRTFGNYDSGRSASDQRTDRGNVTSGIPDRDILLYPRVDAFGNSADRRDESTDRRRAEDPRVETYQEQDEREWNKLLREAKNSDRKRAERAADTRDLSSDIIRAIDGREGPRVETYQEQDEREWEQLLRRGIDFGRADSQLDEFFRRREEASRERGQRLPAAAPEEESRPVEKEDGAADGIRNEGEERQEGREDVGLEDRVEWGRPERDERGVERREGRHDETDTESDDGWLTATEDESDEVEQRNEGRNGEEKKTYREGREYLGVPTGYDANHPDPRLVHPFYRRDAKAKRLEEQKNKKEEIEADYQKASQIPAHMAIAVLRDDQNWRISMEALTERLGEYITHVQNNTYSLKPHQRIFNDGDDVELIGNIAVDLVKHLKSIRDVVQMFWDDESRTVCLRQLNERADQLVDALRQNGADTSEHRLIAEKLRPILLTATYTSSRGEPYGNWDDEFVGFMVADPLRNFAPPPRVASTNPAVEGLFAPAPKGCRGAKKESPPPAEEKLPESTNETLLSDLYDTGMFDDYLKMFKVCAVAKDLEEAINMMLE